MENNKKILQAKRIKKSFSKKQIIKGFDLELKNNEIVGLLGPNGAGKTTTFRMIVGIIKPDEGKIYIDEQDITKEPIYNRAKKGLSYLPQESSIFKNMTVEDNLIAVMEILNIEKKEYNGLLEKIYNEFKIGHLKKRYGYNLSGGERRRVEIARALIKKPFFLLLDEPFAGIDPISIEELQKVIINLKNKNIGVLITDHNVRETLEITDKSYLIYEGKLLISGSSKDLVENQKVKEVYLGEKFKI